MLFSEKLTIFYRTITDNKKLFFIGIIIKLLLGSFLASDYIAQLFAPFLKYAGQDFFGSYDVYNASEKNDAFPYPSIMLAFLSIFKLPFRLIETSQVGFADLLAIRLAVLVADMLILYTLLNWLKQYRKQVYYFYWLSPILMYINYVHGQLDAIPIAFLFLSLYFLFKHKNTSAIVMLALAVGCKTSVLLAVPFVFVYLYKSTYVNKQNWLQYIGLFLGIIIAYTLPFYNSIGYKEMVYNNEQQLKIYSSYINISGTNLLLIVPALYMFLWLRFVAYKQMSRSLLLMYLGFAFGLFTIFIAANQGWYYWSIPFFVYFLITEKRYTLVPFICINIFYFLYYAVIEKSDYITVWQLVNKNAGSTIASYFGIATDNIKNLFGTGLQASILAFCYFLYKYGIAQIKQYKMLYQPYLIGIAGNSASGKTTLAHLLEDIFNKPNTVVINGDDMHRWERNNPMYNEYTHLHPKANNLQIQLQHFLQLAKGISIERKHYDHSSGKFTEAKKIASSKIVIFEGLHTLFFSQQSKWFDLSIFLQPEETVRQHWKIERDVNERGHEKEKVLQSIADRKEDEQLFIQTQSEHADVLIKIVNDNSLVLTCDNIYNLDTLIEALLPYKIVIDHILDNQKQTIIVQTSIEKREINNIAQLYNNQLEDLGIGNANWQGGLKGLLQLFICQIIFSKLQIEAALKNKE